MSQVAKSSNADRPLLHHEKNHPLGRYLAGHLYKPGQLHRTGKTTHQTSERDGVYQQLNKQLQLNKKLGRCGEIGKRIGWYLIWRLSPSRKPTFSKRTVYLVGSNPTFSPIFT